MGWEGVCFSFRPFFSRATRSSSLLAPQVPLSTPSLRHTSNPRVGLDIQIPHICTSTHPGFLIPLTTPVLIPSQARSYAVLCGQNSNRTPATQIQGFHPASYRPSPPSLQTRLREHLLVITQSPERLLLPMPATPPPVSSPLPASSSSSTDSSSTPPPGPPTPPEHPTSLDADLAPALNGSASEAVAATNAAPTVVVEAAPADPNSPTTPTTTTATTLAVDSSHSDADGECFSDEWLADMRRVKVRSIFPYQFGTGGMSGSRFGLSLHSPRRHPEKNPSRRRPAIYFIILISWQCSAGI